MLIAELLESRPLYGLDEAVVIRDTTHMAAYAIAVAEAYDAAPALEPAAAPLWKAFALHNEKVLLQQIAATGVRVGFVDQDAYAIASGDPTISFRFMLWDMIVNKRLLVWTGFSDNHPGLSEKENVIFRAVHDYYGHGKLRATFKKQIEAMGLAQQKPTAEQLAKILPNVKLDQSGNIGHIFSLRGEINAYLTHSRLVPPKIVPVLFTEIVGQTCYYWVAGDFPAQKAAILRGFDYRRIGVGEHDTAPVQHRIDQLMKQIDSQAEVITHIQAKPKVKVAELVAAISR